MASKRDVRLIRIDLAVLKAIHTSLTRVDAGRETRPARAGFWWDDTLESPACARLGDVGQVLEDVRVVFDEIQWDAIDPKKHDPFIIVTA
jgi:hypothetical protein